MISKYTYKGITWIDLESPTESEISHITEEYSIPVVVSKELTIKSLLARADLYSAFIYLILYFPELSTKNNGIAEKEIDFIIGDKYIITTHYGKIEAISKFSKNFEASTLLEKSMDIDHAGFLFFHIIKELYGNITYQFLDTNISNIKNNESACLRLINLRHTIVYQEETLESFGIISKLFFGEKFEYYIIKIKNEHKKVITKINYQKDILTNKMELNKRLQINKIYLASKYIIFISLIALFINFISLWL